MDRDAIKRKLFNYKESDEYKKKQYKPLTPPSSNQSTPASTSTTTTPLSSKVNTPVKNKK